MEVVILAVLVSLLIAYLFPHWYDEEATMKHGILGVPTHTKTREEVLAASAEEKKELALYKKIWL